VYLTPVFLGSVAFVFLNFSLPIYTRGLGADAVEIGGMYTVFTLTMLVFRPVVGRALDRYGRRWFFAFAFLFYTFAMVAFSNAGSLIDFYEARFLQGIGASLMWVAARTIVADLTTDGERGRKMGRLSSVSVQGSMMGAFYGFTLMSMFPLPEAWRLAFVGYAVAALAGFVLSILRFKETAPPSEERPQVLSPVTLERPLIRLLVIVALSNFASALIEPIYLIYLQDKFELSIRALAFAFFPAGIVYAVLPNYSGRWADRYGRPPMIVAGIAAAGMVSLLLPWVPGMLWIALLYTLFAAGWATANPAEDALLGDMTDAHNRGRIFGYKEAAAGVGAAFGPLTGGFIYEYLAAEMSFVANGVLLLLAALLVWRWFLRDAGSSRATGGV
jgi:DHA1 family multidrug resistance protein-like MFS transporter